jgi:transcriptional regulator with XRE-family HTH domain
MDTIGNDPTPVIARRVRDSRREKGWSLEELAQRSGVSKAMLSKIERCKASPTAALLGKISGALGITMSALLTAPARLGARLVRADEQPVWRDPGTGYVRRQVSPLSDLPMHLVEVRLPRAARVAFPASAYEFIRQLVWVIGGSLEFREGNTVHKLGVGDCLELGDPADCEFRNSGRAECRYLVVVVKR